MLISLVVPIVLGVLGIMALTVSVNLFSQIIAKNFKLSPAR